MTFSNEFSNTLLSLGRYANIMQFDPIQFFSGVTALRSTQHCDDMWYQFDWQDGGKVSREELRQAIKQAEVDIANAIGYFPAPMWYTETVNYQQFYQKEYRSRNMLQSNGFNSKTVQATYGYPISGGIRATSQIDAADIFRDDDIDTTGDGFDDTAVFIVSNLTFTDICELKAYFKIYDDTDAENCRTDPGSEGADDYWQIAPIRATLLGTTATVYIPVYLLFKPQLQRQINATQIDADDTDSYVDTIEFYRVYNDPSTQADLLWSSESSCSGYNCAWATQAACLRKASERNGLWYIQPGTYSEGNFTASCLTQGIEPQRAILYYYSGFTNQNSRNCDELSYFWAENIAILATARLDKPICTCENVVRKVEKYQEDLALVNNVRSWNVNLADLSNPLGTTYGAVYIWNRIKNRTLRVGQHITVY